VLALARLDAPWLIDRPINGEAFQCYVEKVLVPTLKPGDIVIMDNLGSHKGKAVRQMTSTRLSDLSVQITSPTPDMTQLNFIPL
jgi:transposase